MNKPWYEVPNPMAGILGFSKKPQKPIPVEAPAPVVSRKVSITDVFVGKPVRQKQVRARNGEVSPTTMRGRVLLAMCKLARGSTEVEIRDADIVYTAWQLWPDVFGLAGYDCPDASKSRAKICGPEGLIGRNMVVRAYEGSYYLTPEGVEWLQSVRKDYLDF
jgi:hypothetical protein